MLGLQSYFDTRYNQDYTAFSSARRPHFTPLDIPWCSPLPQAECTDGISHLKISKDLTGNRTRKKERSTHYLTSVSDGGGWSVPNPGCLSPGKEPLSIGLDRWGKSRPPPGFDPRTVQPVESRYTDYANQAHVHDRLSNVMS